MEARKSIGSRESNENQRRWTVEDYRRVNKKPLHWYDITRQHLNFEIARVGRIQKCGTSKPVHERFAERLAQLGVTPNPEVTKKTPNLELMQNQVVEFIFGGDHDTLQALAFGEQVIDYSADGTADNSHIQRQKGIERWAKDIYDWVCKRYGEDNIIGFDVHLDETTSHIHCTIVPVVPRVSKKTGEIRDVVSFKDLFGKSIEAVQQSMKQLHTDLYEQVNHKYGLMRGDPVELTDAYHRNKYEMYYRLNRELPELELRANDLRKTIMDLEHRIRNCEFDKDALNMLLKEKKISLDEYEKRLAAIEKQQSALEARVRSRKSELMDLDNEIGEKRDTQAKVKAEAEAALTRNKEIQSDFKRNISTMIKGAMFDELLTELKQVFRTLPTPSPEVMKSIDGTLAAELFAGNLNNIIETAGQLVLYGIDAATTIQPSGGGGGSNNDLPKKKDDEDWWKYVGRSIKTARKMARTTGGRKR